MSGAVSSYGTRHLQALFGALGRLVRAPLATMLTLIVIGVALALPAGLALVVNNLRDATGDFSNAVDFSVHFKLGTPIERVQQLAKGARMRAGVESVTVKTADEALDEFKLASGFGDALAALEDNPLPHHLIVRPSKNASGPAEVESLRRYFAAFPEVDIVQLDLDWVRRLHALLDVLRRILWVVIAVLGLGVLAVIGNTIRLEIQQRRPEIEVTKLVGGSNAFVRRPFLYTGHLLWPGRRVAGRADRRRKPHLPRPGRGRPVGPVRQPLPSGGPWQPRDGVPRRHRGRPWLAGGSHFHRAAPAGDRASCLGLCF